MEIRIIDTSISRQELTEMASKEFGDVVKVVVDIVQGIMAIGGELHADEEVVLSEQRGSQREHTWGINLYPKHLQGEEWIEFDSMINIKPQFSNRSRGVEDKDIQQKIVVIVEKLVH